MYVVDEVYYGTNLRMSTCVDGQEFAEEFEIRTPIAFGYTNIKLSAEGAALGSETVDAARRGGGGYSNTCECAVYTNRSGGD